MLYNIYFYETQKKYSNMSKCVTFFPRLTYVLFFLYLVLLLFFSMFLFFHTPTLSFIVFSFFVCTICAFFPFLLPGFFGNILFFFFLHFPPQRQIYGYIYIYRLSNRSSTHMLSNMMFRLCKNSKIGENFAEWIKKKK